MPRRVLVIDDDDRFRRLLCEALETSGLVVVEATKAREATLALERTDPHLAIVDGLLPDSNGIDWIATQRAGGNEMPMVFVSAFWRDLDTYKKLTQELGVALVMHKPLEVARLAERVEVLLRKRAPKSSRPRMKAVRPPAELANAYAEQLPGQLAELDGALARCEAAPDDPDARRSLRSLAHELRGTAGSFGFHDVSDVAGRIEDAVTGPGSLPSELRPMLQTVRAGAGPVSTVPAPTLAVGSDAVESDDPAPTAAIVERPRVLLVDDDTMFLEHAIDTAETQLIDLEVAGTSQQALSIATTDRIEAALVGLPFGDPDGSLELVAALRSAHPDMPIGVVALDDGVDARVGAAQAGAALFVSHPVDAEAFARAVTRLRKDAESNGAIRVATVTEDPVVVDRLASAERGALAVERVDAETMFRTLDHARPDAVVVDARVGGRDGPDICRVLRASTRFHEMPILMLTRTTRVAERTAALEAGCDDCVSKLDPPSAWAERIRLAVLAANRRAGARPDPVTGLPGRTRVLADLSARLSEARRHRRPFAVALFDVDGLASVNADHGRAAGDRVLSSIADLMRSRFRAEDVRGRLGPDELVMGFAGADASIRETLERSRKGFASLELPSAGGGTLSASFSVGVASYPDDGDSVARLLALAEGRLAVDRAARAGTSE